MRACGNDVPRAFVVLFLFPVSEGSAPDSLFLGGVHRSPLLEYPPTCSSPGNFGGVFATSALGFVFQGGVFSGHDPSIGKRGHKNLPGFRCRVLRSRDARHHRGERARDRASDRPRPSECPVRATDRDASATCDRSGCERRDLGRSGVRACGGVAARDARASSAFS